MADLLNADPRGVVFGRSMTQLTMDIARTLARDWGPGDEVVVTRLDHDSNVRTWVHAAEHAGATVRWADFDPETGELDTEQVAAVLSDRTKVVAMTAASNLIGTRPDVAAVAELAHAAGALLYVDGVHYTAHVLVDVEALGADLFACSPYKFLGPALRSARRPARGPGAAPSRQAGAGQRRGAGRASSSARRPTSSWPASPPRSTSWRTWCPATARVASG